MSNVIKAVIASSNKVKIAQFKSFKSLKIFDFLAAEDFNLDEVEESGDTLEENALIKSKYCYEKTGLPSLSDDTGFFINSLDGFPGARCGRIAEFSGKRDYEKATKMLDDMLGSQDRNCVFSCVIAFVAEGIELIVRGDMSGVFTYPGIVDEKGENHGYNPYFIPRGSNLTYAQMKFFGENLLHPRAIAAQNLAKELIVRGLA
jgi:XTP/dITP diphosphohydrolase